MVDLVARYLETYQYESALALARTLYAGETGLDHGRYYPATDQPPHPTAATGRCRHPPSTTEDEKSEERLHVLANVLIRRHEWKAAREALKGFWSPQNRYLRALCCLHLSLLSEGEEALLTASPGSKPSVDAVPLEACGFNLLGRICQRANKHAAAVQHFTTSLTLDPLLWASTKALCELGSATVPVADDEGAPADRPTDNSPAGRPPPPRPYAATPLSQQGASPIGLDESLASASLSTVGVAGQLDFGSSSVSLASPNLTPIGGEPHPSSHGSEASDARGGSVVARQDLASPSPGGAGAGGGRQLLFHSTVSKEGEKPTKLLKGEASLAAGSPLSFSSSGRAPAKWSAASSGPVPPVPRTAAALKQRAVSVLRNVGAAYHYLCQHKCREALGLLQELPAQHYNTGWIQHLVGRAYFEMADYRNAKQALQHMQRLDPHRMHGTARSAVSQSWSHHSRSLDSPHATSRQVSSCFRLRFGT